MFGKPLKESLKYASVQISTANSNGELYVWGYIPVVVAKWSVVFLSFSDLLSRGTIIRMSLCCRHLFVTFALRPILWPVATLSVGLLDPSPLSPSNNFSNAHTNSISLLPCSGLFLKENGASQFMTW